MATITKSMTNIVKSLESSPQMQCSNKFQGSRQDILRYGISGIALSCVYYGRQTATTVPEFPSKLDWLNTAPLQFRRDLKGKGAFLKGREIGNLQKMSETMDSFEQQFVNMEVQAEFMENAMAGSTSLSTPEGDINNLMQQVADDYGLEVSVGLPQAAGHAIPTATGEKVDEDDLSRRLAELKARG
ncbi:unnamed protein product [Eruca vesicaria subsp. sativa]|uniref:Uncharacterized protein n=1 Tax=Eruca vesicaria subsp. sativa TaxID=29727 RepID=A0ABC8JTA8_ERUVS|nr:unnamed protein product [Eruca vesicaria subsp. sativa]